MAVLPGEGTHPILYGSTYVHWGISGGPGYLARPDLAGAAPSLLVVPDVFGLTSFVKALCRRLARHGYAVLAPDIHAGNRPQGRDRDRALESWPGDAAVARLLAGGRGFLASDDTPWSGTSEPGMVAIGAGGGPAVAWAARRPEMPALVLLYATLDEQLAGVEAPLLGLYGRADEVVPIESVMEGRRAAPGGEWVLYQDAAHGFVDDSSPDYHEGAAADALARVLAFLERHVPVGTLLAGGY